MKFADLPVAFRHPFHDKPIFNLSDPQLIVKKLVNALWHSDLPGKLRLLGMWWAHPKTLGEEYSQFSLKALADVYFHEEMGLDGVVDMRTRLQSRRDIGA